MQVANDIVWKRIARGVLTELKRVLPKNEKGRRPRFHDQLELPFEYRPDEDDGKGL